MTIYTRGGAPVAIMLAEKRRRWWANFGDRTEVFDKKPTAKQLRGAKERSEFDIWWIKATQTGAYPDGSGADRIGKVLGYSTNGSDGWLVETEFCADDGIREIHAECETLAAGREFLRGVNKILKA